MKWSLQKYALILLTIICTVGCHKDTIYGTGIMVEEVRSIYGGYSKVKVRNGLVLVVNPLLSKGQVIIKCDEELLPLIMVKTSLTNELAVSYKKSFSFDTPLKTEIHISGDGVESYDIRQSEMCTYGTLQQDSLAIKASEADIVIDLDVDKMLMTADLCDNIRLMGSAELCQMELTSCDIDAVFLETEFFKVQATASRLNANCNQLLSASLMESSSLYYLGDCQTDIEASKDSQCIKMDKNTRR